MSTAAAANPPMPGTIDDACCFQGVANAGGIPSRDQPLDERLIRMSPREDEK
jgi:hypothetical protein